MSDDNVVQFPDLKDRVHILKFKVCKSLENKENHL